MSLIRKAVFSVRRSWEHFAQRTRLRTLPPVPTVTIVLALGILVPLAAQVEPRPTQLSSPLAAERLSRFGRKHPGAIPASGPSGPIYSPRPAFYWPKLPGATRYAFRLFEGDTVVMADDTLQQNYILLKPPGALQPLKAYRFEATPFDAQGRPLPGAVRHAFTVRPLPEDLKSLHELMQMESHADADAFVLLGYFADKDSPHDVISAVVRWSLERDPKAGLQKGGPADWLANALLAARRRG